MRKRNDTDTLFSNAEITSRPTVGIFVGSTESREYKKVMIGDTFYDVNEREIKFYVERSRKKFAC